MDVDMPEQDQEQEEEEEEFDEETAPATPVKGPDAGPQDEEPAQGAEEDDYTPDQEWSDEEMEDQEAQEGEDQNESQQQDDRVLDATVRESTKHIGEQTIQIRIHRPSQGPSPSPMSSQGMDEYETLAKRQSTRTKGRNRVVYTEMPDHEDSWINPEFKEATGEEPFVRKIEDILFKRTWDLQPDPAPKKEDGEPSTPAKPPVSPKLPPVSPKLAPLPPPKDPMYLLKFQGESYLHCEWKSREEVLVFESGQRKLKKYEEKVHTPEVVRKTRRAQLLLAQGKQNMIRYFNPNYTTIDRIIACHEDGDAADYLVKWDGLPYDEATWEGRKELEVLKNFEEKLELFREFEKIPHKDDLQWSRRHKNARERNPNFIRYTTENEFKNGNRLRFYQIDGVNWLVNNWHAHRPCILADEMGLGKTVQTVTFLNTLYEHENIRGPFMICAPLSTLGHWKREFEAWSDMNAVVYHGGQRSRDIIYEYEWAWPNQRKSMTKLNKKWNVLITTKEIVSKDHKLLSPMMWQAIVIDEAHSLKNRKSAFFQRLSCFDREHSVLLTGTPIQNNMKELFSLLTFLSPQRYPDEEDFLEKFDLEKLAKNSDLLKTELQPRLLQRLKQVVEPDLGNRDEKIIWVELTLFQKKWYKALYEKSGEALLKIGCAKSSLMNVSMQLRKCCNHPFLLPSAEDSISPANSSLELIYENLVRASGKLVLLDKLLPKLKREGHRVLIFSQMSRMLDILDDYFQHREYMYERIDGSITGQARQEAIDRFQKHDDIFAFLLTTRAGGVGINLMAADTVIIFDSDWNPMNDLQAIARAHRIGQKRQVQVYRLITRNCYEQEMFKRADQKLALNQVVMGDLKNKTKSEIDNMLKKGAISMFLNEKKLDEEIEQFSKADIDTILAERTEKVVHDKKVRAGDDMFSEAVFVAAEEDAALDVNDPNFWKHIGLASAVKKRKDDWGFGRGVRSSRASRKKISYNVDQAFKEQQKPGSAYQVDEDFAPSEEDGSELEEEAGSIEEALLTHVWGHWAKVSAYISSSQRSRLVQVKPRPKTEPPVAAATTGEAGGGEGGGVEVKQEQTAEAAPPPPPPEYDYSLLEVACTEFIVLLLQRAIANRNEANKSSERKEDATKRWQIILQNQGFKDSLSRTLLHELALGESDEDRAILRSKVCKMDPATQVKRIRPVMGNICNFADLQERLKDDPSVARNLLTKLERLFVLKDTVEGMIMRKNRKADPVCSWDDLKVNKSSRGPFSRWIVQEEAQAAAIWWGPRWDRVLTLATYRLGWGHVDQTVAERCGFHEHFDSRTMGSTKPLLGRFKNQPTFEQLQAQYDELDCSKDGMSRKRPRSELFEPELNVASNFVKRRKWLPADASQQRLTTIISQFRRGVKKRVEKSIREEKMAQRRAEEKRRNEKLDQQQERRRMEEIAKRKKMEMDEKEEVQVKVEEEESTFSHERQNHATSGSPPESRHPRRPTLP